MPGQHSPRHKIAYPRPRLAPDQTEDLPLFGETARLLLGKDLLSVDNNLKNTAAAGNQCNLHIRPEGDLQLFLQTGGPGFIISLCTIFNGNLHSFSLIVRVRSKITS